MRAEILKYDVNAPREQGFSNQRMYPDNAYRSNGFRNRLPLRRQHVDLTKLRDNLLGLAPSSAHLKSSSKAQKPYFTEDHFSGGRPGAMAEFR